jgi:hypothetical protein
MTPIDAFTLGVDDVKDDARRVVSLYVDGHRKASRKISVQPARTSSMQALEA